MYFLYFKYDINFEEETLYPQKNNKTNIVASMSHCFEKNFVSSYVRRSINCCQLCEPVDHIKHILIRNASLESQ